VRLLLDTHVLLWVLSGERLSKEARRAIIDPRNAVTMSAASIWEMSIKAELGRLELPDGWLEEAERQSIGVLPITAAHALAVRQLPSLHRDPFDRMLVAQAQVEGLVLVTRDEQIKQYDGSVLPA
jgi:PIN domain nuclease of toxin-antitoxin system